MLFFLPQHLRDAQVPKSVLSEFYNIFSILLGTGSHYFPQFNSGPHCHAQKRKVKFYHEALMCSLPKRSIVYHRTFLHWWVSC